MSFIVLVEVPSTLQVVYVTSSAGNRLLSRISVSELQSLAKVMWRLSAAIAIQMLIDGFVSVFPSLSQVAL